MNDKKQTLRVATKLMMLIMAGFLLYVFFVGLIGDADEAETVELDVSTIAPGNVEFFNVGKRRLLVLHRSPEQIAALVNADQRTSNAYRSVRPQYFMAWAYDPFFGCDIEYQQTSFKAVCVNNYYDLAGKILNGDVSARDLIVPDYQFVCADRISITINN